VTGAAGHLDRLLEGKQVVVCAGSGGVGKTTASAAIAAGMAARGLKVCVLTIDPARRLADSLGMPELGNEECRVGSDRLAQAGLGGDGELWAMTLDAKQTFDDLIAREAPDSATRDTILANPVYRQLSNAVAGSQEFMAMEKLHELHRSGRYDLVVLDTPPTRNALDFLDAPGRLSRFVDSRSLQFFRASGRAGFGLVGRGTGVLFSVLKRATGVDLLTDLADFFNAIGDMSDGFRDRAHEVEALLCEAGTTFLLVTSPRAAATADARFFHGKLDEAGMPFGGLIVNRVREGVEATAGPELEQELTALLDERLARKVLRDLEDRNSLAARDLRNIALMREEMAGDVLIAVPELEGDVHDLDGLAAVARYLFGAEPQTGAE
jgi:anion-transporting  ArsA/GET3 family ATPase